MKSVSSKKTKSISGASVGILMLQTRFPRVPGDIGHAQSWPFPVHYRIVKGASATAAIGEQSLGLLEPFIDSARDLVEMGVDGITTSCGFLSLMQAELSEAVDVPVASSSLMQVPWIKSLLPPGKRVGVMTIDSRRLTSAHLQAVDAPADTPVAGTEKGTEFTQAILQDRSTMDLKQCRVDNLQAAAQLTNDFPDVGAIVLECTNMVPYAADIQQLTGLPVFSIHTLVSWFQSGLVASRFEP